jgi:hypothetical protein
MNQVRKRIDAMKNAAAATVTRSWRTRAARVRMGMSTSMDKM